MKNLKAFETFSLNEEWYKDPSKFENLKQIDISLGDMRKKLILDINGNKAEFSKQEVDELLDAISSAQSSM